MKNNVLGRFCFAAGLHCPKTERTKRILTTHWNDPENQAPIYARPISNIPGLHLLLTETPSKKIHDDDPIVRQFSAVRWASAWKYITTNDTDWVNYVKAVRYY
jgi:hypothetical protein